jgi:ribosomal protein L7Ae-like RNA K-turn-binding protein
VNKVLGLLGLARRAGGVAPGTEAVRQAIRDGQAKLVLLAADASRAQIDKVQRTLAGRPEVPHAMFGDRDALGAALGVAPVTAVAVTHAALAGQMRAELDGAGSVLVAAGVEG